jgi:hypothetical protein
MKQCDTSLEDRREKNKKTRKMCQSKDACMSPAPEFVLLRAFVGSCMLGITNELEVSSWCAKQISTGPESYIFRPAIFLLFFRCQRVLLGTYS